MAFLKNRFQVAASALIIALGVMACCLALLAFDSGTNTLLDVEALGNLTVLGVHFAPTFLISYSLYNSFSSKNSNKKKVLLSLAIGIPASFVLIISIFYLLR